MELYSYVTIVL